MESFRTPLESTFWLRNVPKFFAAKAGRVWRYMLIGSLISKYMRFRNRVGQFAGSYWKSLSRNQKQMLPVIVLCAAVISGGTAYEKIGLLLSLELTYIAAPRAEASVLPPNKIEEMKDDVLDRLAKCESGGKETTIVFDSNGKASVGNYQWQLASFQHYHFKMTGEKATEREAARMALDDVKARALASWVIFETDAGSGKDWVNCTNWHDLDTLVDFIKSHK